MIIAEAHGDGRKEDFRPQEDFNFEACWLADYYRRAPLKNFHQQQIRDLLQHLDDAAESQFRRRDNETSA